MLKRMCWFLVAGLAMMLPGVTEEGAFPLWDSSRPVPGAEEIPVLEGVALYPVKAYEPEKDGYHWLHGGALAWHKGRLYASFGHNKGKENTAAEEAKWRVSDDGGKTWGPVCTIDCGDEPNLAVSHGVFFSLEGRLWAFHGAFYNAMERVHTRAYVLDEAMGNWEHKGVVLSGGFWPMQEPRFLDDGQLIMAGIRVGSQGDPLDDPAAVALTHWDVHGCPEGLLRWDLVQIPKEAGMKVWGESTVFVRSGGLLNVSRYSSPLALASESRDGGRTWSILRETNLPMAASKPYGGTLSTGQEYLICSTSSDGGNRRAPLTIALTAPGETVFSRVFVIRHAVQPGGIESNPNTALSYPYAVEHDGSLYVVYSADGGRGGNRNSAELAVIPITSLAF